MADGDNKTKRQQERRPIIVRGRITKIDAEKIKDAPIAGIELGVEFDSVSANGDNLEVRFTYRAVYKEQVGHISMSGFMLFEMDEQTAKKFAEQYEKERNFEPAFMESIINNINYKCSTEAIFTSKIIELTAPIVPPRIGLRNPSAADKAPMEKEKQAPPPATQRHDPNVGESQAKGPAPTGGIKTEQGFQTGSPKSSFPFPPSVKPPFGT